MRERRLYVHIGLQKTGTSYLQAVMLGNRDELAAQGADLVPRDQAADLRAHARRPRALPARPRPGVGDRRAASLHPRAGRGDRLAGGARARSRWPQHRATRYGASSRPAATARYTSWRRCATWPARLPSAWQQYLKSGGTLDYEPVPGEHPGGRTDRKPQPVLAPSRRAGHPGQVEPRSSASTGHTWSPCHRPAAHRTLLLERFARVLDVDASRLRLEERPHNAGLGRVQADLLRRVNHELPDELLRRQVYGNIGKRYLASQVLSSQVTGKIRVPGPYRDWVEETSARQVAALADAGYAVEGDLADLLCVDSSFADDEAAAHGRRDRRGRRGRTGQGARAAGRPRGAPWSAAGPASHGPCAGVSSTVCAEPDT